MLTLLKHSSFWLVGEVFYVFCLVIYSKLNVMAIIPNFLLYLQNAPPPRGSEPIVTLGGIDLNNTARCEFKIRLALKKIKADFLPLKLLQ